MKKQNVTSNAWHIALVLVGTVVGAGFVSGAEIITYFAKYGEAGLWTIGLAGLLFFLGTYGTLKIAYEYGNTEYGAFAETIAGKWLGTVLDILVSFSMLLGYGVMLAGSGAVFLQQWGVSEWVGSLCMAAATLLAMKFGPDGIVTVNRFLTPLLIAGIIFLSIYSIWTAVSVTETVGLSLQPLSIFTAQPLENLGLAMRDAVVYASYNMLGAGAVLVVLAKQIKSNREACTTGVIAALILVVLTFALGLATFLNYDTIVNIPIPALELLRDHQLWQRLYVIVLLGAMYTTAVSDGFGFVSRMQSIWPNKRSELCIVVTIIALLLSHIGFSDMVAKGYRLFGYIGIGQILFIVVKCIPKKENIYGKQERRKQR